MDNLREFFGRVFRTTPANPPDNNLEKNTTLTIRPRNSEESDKDFNVNMDKYFHTYRYTRPDLPDTHSDNDSNGGDFNNHNSTINSHPEFVFGNLFSVMGSMFSDMERSMRDMEQFFEGDTFFNRPEFRMLEDIDQFQQPSDGSLDDKSGLTPKIKSDENVRDLILRNDAPPISNEDKVDTNLDELYKANKINVDDVLELLDKKRTPSTEVVPVPNPRSLLVPAPAPHARSSFESTSTESIHSYQNGKWLIQEKIVKQTPEGKEITTRTTKENGDIETKTEFFRSNDADKFKSYNDTDENFNIMANIFEKLFRPRM